MGVMITSEVATIGEIDIPGQGQKQFTTQPGQVTTITIPRTLEMIYGEEAPKPTVHITSRAPISVYVMNSRYQSSGGYAAVPVNVWGTTYTPVTLPNADGGRVSEFLVIAAYDSTLLTIYPSARTNYKYPGQDITVALRKGESYLVQAWPILPGVADLSTSEIRSSRPVGVISGHVRTPITANRTVPLDLWASHQASMLLPRSMWGKEYVSIPTRQTPDRFRVTTESIEPVAIEATHYPAGRAPEKITFMLKHGQIFDSTMLNGRPITGPVHWSSTEPILVTQFRTSGAYGDAENSPSMLPLVPLAQFSTHTAFVAPAFIGPDPLTTHTLTIIARGPAAISTDDPNNPLRSLMLDDTPVHTLAPQLLTQQIGSTGLYYVTLPIDEGGHTLRSHPEHPFTAIAQGNNGGIGDFYTWVAPFWLPQVEIDRTPPRVLSMAVNSQARTITTQITDNTPPYFSGIWEVKVVENLEWQITAPFMPQDPDNDVEVSFRSSNDPSGPLYLELRDRDGNVDTVKVSDGICSKTAYASRSTVEIIGLTKQTVRDSILISANPCGSQAIVQAIDMGTGNAKNYLTVTFENNLTPPFTIPSSNSAMLYFTVDPNTPEGIYVTTITITLDTSIILIPVQLDMRKQGVSSVEAAEPMRITIYPNPFTLATRIDLGEPLGTKSQITISDHLGRAVRHFQASELAGRSTATWNGLDDNGILVPTGVYFITIADGSRRSVHSATLVR